MYASMTKVMAGLMIFLGVAMLSFTLVHGFGVGVILGVLFITAGVGRLLVLRRARG